MKMIPTKWRCPDLAYQKITPRPAIAARRPPRFWIPATTRKSPITAVRTALWRRVIPVSCSSSIHMNPRHAVSKTEVFDPRWADRPDIRIGD